MKKKEQEIIAKMIETIGYIRDAETIANAFYSASAIRQNMSEYFSGLAFALGVFTGYEYHWSKEDENDWALVIQDRDNMQYIHL